MAERVYVAISSCAPLRYWVGLGPFFKRWEFDEYANSVHNSWRCAALQPHVIICVHPFITSPTIYNWTLLLLVVILLWHSTLLQQKSEWRKTLTYVTPENTLEPVSSFLSDFLGVSPDMPVLDSGSQESTPLWSPAAVIAAIWTQRSRSMAHGPLDIFRGRACCMSYVPASKFFPSDEAARLDPLPVAVQEPNSLKQWESSERVGSLTFHF